MIRRFIPLLGLLTITACGDNTPPPSLKPLNYSYLPPIVLNVSTVTVVNQYVPDAGAASLIAQDPAPPAQILNNTLTRRLVAGGTPGTATITIESASIEQQNGNYNGVMAVRVDVQSADGRSHGYTEASVTHSASVPEDSSQVPAALYDMTKQMMDAMNVQLQYQMQHNLSSWISYSVAPGMAAAPVAAPYPTAPAAYPTSPAAYPAAPALYPAAPALGASAPASYAPASAPAPGQYLPAPPLDTTAPALAAPKPLAPSAGSAGMGAPPSASYAPIGAPADISGGIQATPLDTPAGAPAATPAP